MIAALRKEIKRPLDMKRLKSILPTYCRVVRYDDLAKAKTLRQAMSGASVLILLWNIHDTKHRVLNKAGHFYAISTRGPEPCVVFSSMGFSPRKELFLTHSDPGLLERILPKGTVYNNVKLQTGNDSQTCWRWCVIFAHLAKMGLQRFQELFGKPTLSLHDPDLLAVAMTYILLA